MEERTLIEVGTTDATQLIRSLGIPEDDIYIELEPGVKLFCSDNNVQVRRGGTDVLPYVVEFIIAVAAPLTRPLSINGPKNNDKKMKWLVEPIGILVVYDVLFEEEREGILCASVQSACRARRMSIDNPYRCFWVR